jgi:hypothetical protein
MRKLPRALQQRRGRRHIFTGSPAIPSSRVDIVKTGSHRRRIAAKSARRGPNNADETIAENGPEMAKEPGNASPNEVGVASGGRPELRRDGVIERSTPPRECAMRRYGERSHESPRAVEVGAPYADGIERVHASAESTWKEIVTMAKRASDAFIATPAGQQVQQEIIDLDVSVSSRFGVKTP